MADDFRKEIFKLCKKLYECDDSLKIRKVIYDMSVVADSKESGVKRNNANEDFAYMAKYYNNEFYGFVYLDDNIDKMKIPKFLKPKHLSRDERKVLEKGHKTLVRFVELCLSDIALESDMIAEAVNPYFGGKNVRTSDDTTAILTDEEMRMAVEVFKNGKVYKALMTSNLKNFFSKIDVNMVRTLLGGVENEINQSLGEDVSKDLRDFSMKLHSKLDNITDIMFSFLILLYALKMSLKFSCHMLYRAICGIDLLVLNNDNIINIEKRTSTILSEYFKVFSQELCFDFTRSEMGSVLLIDCDFMNDIHIHEFGILVAQTTNLMGEFGSSAKYSFLTINEELIHIHNLVDEILKADLPVVS